MMLSPRPRTALSLLSERRSNNGLPAALLLLQRRRKQRCGRETEKDNVFELKLGITEIVGGAGCGKTQIALGICLASAITPVESPKFNSQSTHATSSSQKSPFGLALFVSLGEGTTQSAIAKRLSQMATMRKAELSSLHNQSLGDILKRILTRSLRNEEEFTEFVFHDLPKLLENERTIKVLALDSVAAMFRHCDGKVDREVPRRSATLFRITAHLKYLSEKHNLPIIILNQVTADFARPGNRVLPALGLSWAHCVTESFLVSKQEGTSSSELALAEDSLLGTEQEALAQPAKSLRLVRSRFSPWRRSSELSFLIDSGGPFSTPYIQKHITSSLQYI